MKHLFNLNQHQTTSNLCNDNTGRIASRTPALAFVIAAVSVSVSATVSLLPLPRRFSPRHMMVHLDVAASCCCPATAPAAGTPATEEGPASPGVGGAYENCEVSRPYLRIAKNQPA